MQNSRCTTRALLLAQSSGALRQMAGTTVLSSPAMATSLRDEGPGDRVNATSHPFVMPLPNHYSKEEWGLVGGGEAGT